MQSRMAEARDLLDRETNILEIIKMQRLSKLALSQLMPHRKIKELNSRARYTPFNLNS